VVEQPVPREPAGLAGRHIVYVRCLHDEYDDGTLAVDAAGTVWRPKYDPTAKICHWSMQALTPALLESLAVPPSAAKLIL
jgi:hypothetical protein